MFCAGQAPGGYALERVFGRAFAQMRLVNTARVLTSPPLHKITLESIALLRIRPTPDRLVFKSKDGNTRCVFTRAFKQMRLDNTARVLPAAPLSEITRKSITLPCIRIDACPAYFFKRLEYRYGTRLRARFCTNAACQYRKRTDFAGFAQDHMRKRRFFAHFSDV